MLRAEITRGEGNVDVSLFDDDGVALAAWVQPDDDQHFDRSQLLRSHDGVVATVVVDDRITVVRLADGHIAASGKAGRAVEATFPLDARWTLEVEGELEIDGGFTGHYNGGMGFFWAGPEPRPPAAELETLIARGRAEFAADANRLLRRRLALRDDTQTVLIHASDGSRADGAEMLLWPPLIGPTAVLFRHAVVTDDGQGHSVESQPPWLVRNDGTVEQLPFELGVSPLLALADGRWLLPGADALWRDGYDEPMGIVDVDGRIERLLIGGEVCASRILRDVVPDVLAALEPIDPRKDVPWSMVSARLDADELLTVIEVEADEDAHTVIAAGLSLAGATPARLVARVESTRAAEVVVAF